MVYESKILISSVLLSLIPLADDNFFPKDSDGVSKVNNDYHFTQTWAALEKIYESGRAKAIGVSNFSIKT